MQNKLKNGLINLKKLRERREAAKSIMQNARDAFNNTYEKEIAEIDELEHAIANNEEEIRSEGMGLYCENRDKNIGYGVKARILMKLDYAEGEAFKWAKEHGIALKLDTKVFEKIAKADKIDFVQLINKIQITIPKEIKGEE